MTKARSNTFQQAERIFRKHGGLLSTTQTLALGIHPRTLYALRDRGRLIQVGRGLYELAEKTLIEHHSLAIACIRVPKGIICLLSALRFHDLTTQAPFEIWLAIDRLARKPKEERLPLRVFRFSGQALQAGVEEHEVEGVRVPVYNPAKTVADCFKYRTESVKGEKIRGQEKFQAMVTLGINNSRMKDFYDLFTLASAFHFDGETLRQAIKATFKRRQIALPDEMPLALTQDFAEDQNKQKQWRAFLNKNRLRPAKDDPAGVVATIRKFLMPPILALANKPEFKQVWRPGGQCH
jgi:hypothetical protein